MIERRHQTDSGKCEACVRLIDGTAYVGLRCAERSKKILPAAGDAEKSGWLPGDNQVLAVWFGKQRRFEHGAMELVSGFDVGRLHNDPFAAKIDAGRTIRLIAAYPCGKTNLQPIRRIPVQALDRSDLTGKDHLGGESESRGQLLVEEKNERRVLRASTL